jgi:hypothetical protein
MTIPFHLTVIDGEKEMAQAPTEKQSTNKFRGVLKTGHFSYE